MRSMAAAVLLSCEGFADFIADVELRHSRRLRRAAAAAAEGGGSDGAAAEDAAAAGAAANGGAVANGAAAEGVAATAAVPAVAGEGEESASSRLGDSLTAAIRALDPLDWMVPPMLQAR